MRGSVTALAVAVVCGCIVGQAGADPQPDPAVPVVDAQPAPAAPAADRARSAVPDPAAAFTVPPAPMDPAAAVDQIITLSHEAERANQAVLAQQQKVDAAEADQRAAEARRDAAQAAVDAAQAAVDRYRDTADRVAAANYQGVQVNKLYALMLSKSPQQLLDQMSVLDQITFETEKRLAAYKSAEAEARAARAESAKAADEAAQATTAAQDAQARLRDKQDSLQGRINEVRELYGQMTGAARAQLAGALIPAGFDIAGIVGAGPEFAALQVALTRIGDPYVWGATGPHQFDCSGLVQWAYAQVGIDVPRTSQQQAQGGTPVNPADMQPGDVVTFYDDVSHVGIYAGNGMMVHASTFGVPVKVQTVDSFPIHNVRRY
ncbi:C40 family peptidase [Tomitella cavernea]|uniref:C40 family peptidase n=1 Tax=Tomitella cavernea TaxID=1387982 RepID=UPI00190699BD|nr:C40 family peptidase [Tomitella cavernea]